MFQNDGRGESPGSEKGSDSKPNADKGGSPPKDAEHKTKNAAAKATADSSGDHAKGKATPRKDSKKSASPEAKEAKKTEVSPARDGTAPTSAKPKTSSVHTSSSGSGSKNKLQEEKKDSSVKKPAEGKNAVSRLEPSKKAVSPVSVQSAEADKKTVELELTRSEVEMAPLEHPSNDERASTSPEQQRTSGVTTGQKPLVPEPDDFDHLEKAAEDLMATWTAEEDEKSNRQAAVESGSVPMSHEDAKKWFYKDPQGDLQGKISVTVLSC